MSIIITFTLTISLFYSYANTNVIASDITKISNDKTIDSLYIDMKYEDYQDFISSPQLEIGVVANSVRYNGAQSNHPHIKINKDTSFAKVEELSSKRYSFDIELKNSELGFENITLHNLYNDISYFKELLAFELYNDMGVTVPYYSLVKLYFADSFFGIYLMTEKIDEFFLTKNFGDGYIYKITKGSSLLYNYEQVKNIENGFEYNYDLDHFLTLNDPIKSHYGLFSNPLAGVNFITNTREEIESSINSGLTIIKKLDNFSNYEHKNSDIYIEELSKVINIDMITKYFAINTFLVNLIGHNSNVSENIALYISTDGMIQLIPTSLEAAFGGYGVSTASEFINYDIHKPLYGVELNNRPLFKVILESDVLKADYYEYLKNCSEIVMSGGIVNNNHYPSDYYKNNISDYMHAIDRYVYGDMQVTPFYRYSQYIEACNTLKSLIEKRAYAVGLQTTNSKEKVDASQINIQAIGLGYKEFSSSINPSDGNTPLLVDNPEFQAKRIIFYLIITLIVTITIYIMPRTLFVHIPNIYKKIKLKIKNKSKIKH